MSMDPLTWGVEPNSDNRKSEIIKRYAKEKGIKLLDIGVREQPRGDFKGLPYGPGLGKSAHVFKAVRIDANLSNLEPVDLRGLPETLELTRGQIIEDREIRQGDMVLMEYARGITETVVVEEIIDGIVYGLGDDGEPYSAPVANCDKVPF
jgi:hypothetical protein